MNVEHWNAEADGELTEERLRRKLVERGYMVTRYVYPPGAYFPEHEHGVDKIDAVLSGRFRMTMSGETVILEAGGCMLVPRRTMHMASSLFTACLTSGSSSDCPRPPRA